MKLTATHLRRNQCAPIISVADNSHKPIICEKIAELGLPNFTRDLTVIFIIPHEGLTEVVKYNDFRSRYFLPRNHHSVRYGSLFYELSRFPYISRRLCYSLRLILSPPKFFGTDLTFGSYSPPIIQCPQCLCYAIIGGISFCLEKMMPPNRLTGCYPACPGSTA